MKETISISGALVVFTAIFQTSSANPVGGNVTVGSATITQNGDILSVVTGSNKTVIDWDSFSISAGQLTQIMQPGANSATLNRVIGTVPSELLGTLVSNGKVALINENGILVGNTGIIDTHGFIGSTLNTTNEAFLANGNMVFSGGSEASIVNRGAILARQGDVFLLGRNVTNAGSIEAQNGNAGLAAGGEIVLRKASDEHVYVEVKSSSRGDKVVNSGTIKAIQDDLHHNGGNPYQYAMNTGNTGVNNIQVRPGGGVYLNAGTEGSVVHSGSIKAVKGDKGGDVGLSGRTVDVKSGSKIDASGARGGGTVKVGGGFKGKDGSIANSKATRVEQGAEIKADATESGKGGQVVVWSDGATSYAGSISAKGAGTGSGGSAEVSGKEYLDFRGEADLTAANGHKGDLLLDPANITIQASNPDIAGNGSNNDLTLPGDLSDADLDFPGANSVITAAKVADLATLSNLTLAATNDITVNAPIDTTSLSTPFTSTFDLTLQAGHDITINGNIVNQGTGGVTLSAGNDILVNAGIYAGGKVVVEAGNDVTITNGGISDNSVDGLLVSAGRNLTLDGTIAAPGFSGSEAVLKFGQSGPGTFTFGAGAATGGGIVKAFGGAGDDKVVMNAFPINAQMKMDLAGGNNSVTLSAGNDDIVATAPNEISTNTGVFIDNVSSVDGGGGVQNIIQGLDGTTMTITGQNALTTQGMTFTDFQWADGDGSPENFMVINGTADPFIDLGHSVAGVEVGTGVIVQTSVLNVSGSGAFTVGGANSGNGALGSYYVGLNTVNGTGSNNSFGTYGVDVTITGPGTVTAGGIAFTGVNLFNRALGDAKVINATSDPLDLGTLRIDGVALSNFTNFQTAAVVLGGTNHSINFTGPGAITTSFYTLTGLTSVDAGAGTNSLTLSGGADIFNATGSRAGSTGGIDFAHIDSVNGGAGANILTNSTGLAFDGGAKSVAGMTFTNFGTVNTQFLNLTSGNDTFALSGPNAGSFNGINYTGVASVNGLGGADTFTNGTAQAFDAATSSVAGVSISNFEFVQTSLLNLTTGDDVFTLSSPGSGTFNGRNYTGLTKVDGLGGNNTFQNESGTIFAAATNTAGGVVAEGFDTIATSAVSLTDGDDTITQLTLNTFSFGSKTFTNVGYVDALGGTDTYLTNLGHNSSFSIVDQSASSVRTENFEKIQAFTVELTNGDDVFTVTGPNTGTIGGQTFFGVGTVDGRSGNDLIVNQSGQAFDAYEKAIDGVYYLSVETVSTAAVSLGTHFDIITITGQHSAEYDGLKLIDVNQITDLGGTTDVLVNHSGLAFDASDLSVAGITTSGFETVDTPLLNLTAGNDIFTTTGIDSGRFSGVNYTSLTKVNALGGSDLLVNTGGFAFNAGTGSAGSITTAGFETIQTAQLALTSGDDTFTVTGANEGTFGGQTFVGLNKVDGLGGSDTLLNNTASAFSAATNSVAGITQANFETVNTSLLTLTSGDDLFTVTGANAGSLGSLHFTGLTQVDGLGGSDTLVNSTGLVFDGGTISVAGVTGVNFETIQTPLLNLTGGDDLFTLTGSGTGTFAGLNYTGLVTVDALGGSDTFVNNSGAVYDAGNSSAAGVTTANFEIIQTAQLALTGGNDVFTVTGANAGVFGGQSFTGLNQIDGLGGNDTLVNSTALAFDAATNSVSGVAETNFETVNTALLTLTAGDDLFTVTGANAGTFGALNFTGLNQVDGLGGSNTLVNGTALAFEASTLSVSGVTAANFGTVNTALLNLTAGDDVFALTGSGTGTFAGINYTGLTSVDALGGSNTVALTGGDDSFTVTGTRAGTGSAVAFANLDKVDGAGGSDTLVNGTALAFEGSTNSVAGVTETNFETISTDKLNLTTGDDSFTVTGANAGTFGGLNFINLTQVDGLAGSDTLVNATPGAFDGATNTVAGVTQSNFETVSTALLTLTTGDDLFTVTGGNAGTFGGLSFINLTQVDALAGTDAVVLTAGDDVLTVTGTGAVATSGIALNHVEAVDGGTGVNGITLTAGDDVFTAGGTRAGTGLGIAFTNIDSINGGGGTDTYVGTSGADAWSITGTNAGSLLGASFSGFSQLRSGGTAVDTFNFAAGGDVTGFISGTDGGNGNLAALAFANSGVATNLTGSVRANGLRLASSSGGSFTLLNAGNNIVTLAANLDGALNFRNGSAFTVGTVDGTTGLTTTGDAITLDTAGGGITLAADVSSGSTAAGDITLNPAVTLAANTTITGGNVSFNNTVNGGFGLTVNSGGTTTFAGAIGGSSALISLTTDAGGSTALNGGAVTTSGAQIYGDTVTLGAPASVFTGDSVTFAASLDGASATTVNAVTTLFGGAVGSNTALASLTTDASGLTTVSGGSIRTSGAQVFNDAVTLGSATSVFTGAAVTFVSTLNGASDTTVSATTTTFGAEVGGGVALNSLTTDAGGSVVIQGPAVRTTGAQNYGDDVSLTNATSIFSGSGVTFGAKLDGASAVTVNATDTIFNGAVGSGTALASLTTDVAGTTQINGGSIVTTGAQLYSDAVSLGEDTLLQGGSLDFVSIAAAAHNLALHAATTISLGDTINATKLNLQAGGNVTQKAGSKLAIGELSGDTHGKTVLFNPDNQIVTIGNFNAGGDLLIFDSGTSGGGAAYGMNVTGHVNGQGSVWLVEGSGGLKVDPGASVSVDGLGNGLLLVGGLDLALGIPGSGELVLKGNIDLTNGARGFLVMNSIGLNGGSDLTGARHLIKSLNFSFDPTLPLVFGDALRTQATVGPLDYNQLSDVIASKLPNPVLGPLTAAVFQSPKPDTDSASQISDITALVRGFFNDLDTGDEKVTNDASAIVEIGKMARFESGVYPPAYGPFALTSYEYEWWLQEKNGQVKDKDMFYHRRYPLYLKQKGKGADGRPDYESILEDR